MDSKITLPKGLSIVLPNYSHLAKNYKKNCKEYNENPGMPEEIVRKNIDLCKRAPSGTCFNKMT